MAKAASKHAGKFHPKFIANMGKFAKSAGAKKSSGAKGKRSNPFAKK